jgi:hypothetical protein
MEKEFRIGQKVLCIDNFYSYLNDNYNLNINEVYTIEIIYSTLYIKLEGKNMTYSLNRFVDAEKYLHDKKFNNKINKLIE